MFGSKSGNGQSVKIEYAIICDIPAEHSTADQFKVALIVLDTLRNDKHSEYRKLAGAAYDNLYKFCGKRVSQLSQDDKLAINRWYLKAYELNML